MVVCRVAQKLGAYKLNEYINRENNIWILIHVIFLQLLMPRLFANTKGDYIATNFEENCGNRFQDISE